MKQIFDLLREQMRKHIYTDFTDTDSIEFETAISLVDEAEAKWEADCCVWKYRSPASYAEAHGFWEFHDTVKGWKFCPYCGKPIKISEVE